MNIALDTDRVSIIQGDTLETLRALSDKSVDIIVTDPPYSPHTHEKHGKERAADGRQVHRKELEFPPMTTGLMALIVEQYIRVCKGWIISFSDFRQSYLWGMSVQFYGGSWVRTGAWIKTNPMPQMTGDRPATGHEDIVIAHAAAKGFEWNAKGRPATWRGTRDVGYGCVLPDGTKLEPHPNQKPAWLLQSIIGMFAPRPRMECSGCAYSISVDDLPLVSEAFQEDARSHSLLQQAVQCPAHGQDAEQHEGLRNHEQGLPRALPPGSSVLDADGLHPRAPSGDGEASRAPATSERGCAPSEREQARQPDGESASARQSGARRASEATRLSQAMPPLWRGGAGVWSCPCCRTALVKRGPLILDPFFGSGTTAIGALANERLEGEVLIETSCAKCVKKHADRYRAPLPDGVRVLGIEGDPRYVDLSISRIRDTVPGVLAA